MHGHGANVCWLCNRPGVTWVEARHNWAKLKAWGFNFTHPVCTKCTRETIRNERDERREQRD